MTDLRLKCTKFNTPDTAGATYSAPPDPLVKFGGRFAAEGGPGLGRGGKGKGGRGSGGEGPQVTVEPGPLTALLRHCVAEREAHSILSQPYQM